MWLGNVLSSGKLWLVGRTSQQAPPSEQTLVLVSPESQAKLSRAKSAAVEASTVRTFSAANKQARFLGCQTMAEQAAPRRPGLHAPDFVSCFAVSLYLVSVQKRALARQDRYQQRISTIILGMFANFKSCNPVTWSGDTHR